MANFLNFTFSTYQEVTHCGDLVVTCHNSQDVFRERIGNDVLGGRARAGVVWRQKVRPFTRQLEGKALIALRQYMATKIKRERHQ